MIDLFALRDRYTRDTVQVRMGGLAANLLRIKSFSDNPKHAKVVRQLIIESEHFAEWAGVDSDINVQAKLVDLQILLAQWAYTWDDIWHDKTRLRSVAAHADRWAQDILRLSRLEN